MDFGLNPFERFVEKHLGRDSEEKPWYWGSNGILCNASITFEFVEKYCENDNKEVNIWYSLSGNTFEKEMQTWREYIKNIHIETSKKILLTKLNGHESLKYRISSFLF